MLTSAETSGIVTGDAPVSYWPIVFSLAPVTVLTVFVKLNLAHAYCAMHLCIFYAILTHFGPQ